MTVIFITSGTTWTVPSDWNSASNMIEAIGGGGGPYNFSVSFAGAGGGGGAYAFITNFAATPGDVIPIIIGAGGTTRGSGGFTYFNTSGFNNSTSSLIAAGGSSDGAGGQASACAPTTGAQSGGAAGTPQSSAPYGGSGGGGAGGPHGPGGAGGSTASGNGGSGGGGSDGGGAGVNAPGVGNNGTNGGAAHDGTPGGLGSTVSSSPGQAGSHGSGGGGGFGNVSTTGGAGGAGIGWVQTSDGAIAGPGGGGGAGGGNAGVVPGANGGLYGGGAGGCGYNISGNLPNTGAPGIIVITYTPVAPTGSTGEADGFATVAGVGAGLSGAATGEADGFATVAGVGGVGPVIHPAAGRADGFATVNGAGYAIVTPDVLPGPSGLGWSLHRRPTFETIVASHPSGSEVRMAQWMNALWEFELTYDGLSSSAVKYPGLGADSLQTMMGFYLAHGGSRDRFLYLDPDFNTVTLGPIAFGDGLTASFPLVRVVGGAQEPVSWVISIAQVQVGGATVGGWSLLNPATLVFASPPASGASIAATFTYAFTCRFLDDTIDFEEFMSDLWQLKSFKFRQVRL